MNTFLTFSFMLLIAPITTHALHVIVDPGHGGEDHGAVYYGVKEADINLQVGSHLARLLKNDSRFKVTLTRHKDTELSLEERAELARRAGGNVFLSIHTNAFNRPQAKGVEFYFQNQLPPDEEAMFLAKKENDNQESRDHIEWPLQTVPRAEHINPEVLNIIQDLQLNFRIRMSSQLAENLYNKWNGYKKSGAHSLKQAPFFVISNVNMPSSLIELGYLSNKNEAQLLSTPQYQKQMAQSLYSGLIKYKEFIDKTPANNLD